MPKRKPEPETVCDPTSRDYVMARVAAARASAQAAVELCDAVIDHCVDPTKDKNAKQRLECLEGATEALGAASRSLEEATEVVVLDDEFDPGEGEDYDDEDGEDEDDEEGEDDED